MNAIESIRYIYPELVLLIFSLAILIFGLFVKRANLLAISALIGIALSALFLAISSHAPGPIFSNLLANDSFSTFFKIISLLVTFIVILISMGYKLITEDRGEYYFLLLVTTIGMMLAVSSNNLLMIYVAVETVSIISYMLVGFLKHEESSSEGALKYFLFGTLATGIMLYGISFIYGLFGTTDLVFIYSALAKGEVNSLVLSVSLLLILAGIAFKCALFPFHMWVPDAYEGAPTPITAFISTAPKAVGFAILLRIFLKCFAPVITLWPDLFTWLAILTMTVGNIIAISQSNIKRMLGYSSIAQAGYIFIGFVVKTPFGEQAVLYYMLVYVIMNLGAFCCIVMISNSIKSDFIKDYSGLNKTDPVSAGLLTIFLLSLAGIPPLAGFFGKFMVFAAAIQAKFILLAVAAIINAVIAFYYYVYVIKCMYLDEPKVLTVLPKSLALKFGVIIALIGVLVAGLWPSPFINWISGSIVNVLK